MMNFCFKKRFCWFLPIWSVWDHLWVYQPQEHTHCTAWAWGRLPAVEKQRFRGTQSITLHRVCMQLESWIISWWVNNVQTLRIKLRCSRQRSWRGVRREEHVKWFIFWIYFSNSECTGFVVCCSELKSLPKNITKMFSLSRNTINSLLLGSSSFCLFNVPANWSHVFNKSLLRWSLFTVIWHFTQSEIDGLIIKIMLRLTNNENSQ